MEEGEDLGLSMGEMSVDVAGVESAVAMRRKAVSDGRAVVVMFESRGVCRNTSLEKWWGRQWAEEEWQNQVFKRRRSDLG